MSKITRLYKAMLVRLFARVPGRAHQQRGASALAHIVLAAALILIIAIGINAVGSGAIEEAFQSLFDSAGSGGGSDSSGGAPT